MTRKRPKKAEPPKDFAKKKQKVGKGKRAPDNATVPTFKSHSIVIRSQLEQRTDQPTTHRKLTLQVSIIVILGFHCRWSFFCLIDLHYMLAL